LKRTGYHALRQNSRRLLCATHSSLGSISKSASSATNTTMMLIAATGNLNAFTYTGIGRLAFSMLKGIIYDGQRIGNSIASLMPGERSLNPGVGPNERVSRGHGFVAV
jgi:hypothetical protein